MPYGLSENTITALQNTFARHEGIQKAVLHGSRAKGTYRNGSDIDLTLFAPTLSFQDLLRLETELDDLLLPYQIDLSLHHRLRNAQLLEDIERVGMTLYESPHEPND